MFSLLHSGVLALRLPRREREEFLKNYNATLYEACGTVMKEYVTVPEALLKDTQAVQKHLAVSYAYVQTLQPKATKKQR
jgi:TfoX/Sxy family transcriptional regulator of competence genes